MTGFKGHGNSKEVFSEPTCPLLYLSFYILKPSLLTDFQLQRSMYREGGGHAKPFIQRNTAGTPIEPTIAMLAQQIFHIVNIQTNLSWQMYNLINKLLISLWKCTNQSDSCIFFFNFEEFTALSNRNKHMNTDADI